MPGAPKEEQEARKSDDHQDNKAAKDLEHEMGKDPKRMEKMVSLAGLNSQLGGDDGVTLGFKPETDPGTRACDMVILV